MRLPDPGRASEQRGAASVEHVAMVLLAAAIAIVAVAGARTLAREGGTPPLASELLRKQRCAVRYPGPCWQDPLSEAYGRSIAGAVRALAPAPRAVAGPDGVGLVGVDYRSCRQVRCATPRPGADGLRLTVSNRRATTFTALAEDELGGAEISYWSYRPTLGWELIERVVTRAKIVARARTPLLESANPKLIPLETLLGRDEARFTAAEEPPWRNQIESRWGGR